MPVPKLTAEHRHELATADAFIAATQPVLREMSAILGGLCPQVFKDFQIFPLPNIAERPCGAWAACVINNGGNHPDETNVLYSI